MVSAGAVGFYFVMVMGMFDFSIGANIMLSSIVGTVVASRFGLGYFGLIAGCILTGAIVGLLNGFLYVKLHIPSMIVTTGLALIYEAIASYIAGGQSATLPSDLRAFGSMPGNLILAVIAFLAAYLLLNYTRIGTYTYAIGSDEFVAKNMGINVNKYKVLAFGDSYNDIPMVESADVGILYCPPDNVVRDYPQFPVARNLAELKALIEKYVCE
jgi:ribose transport system permease protein